MRSSLGNIFCLMQLYEKENVKNLQTHWTFVNLNHALDSGVGPLCVREEKPSVTRNK